MNSTTDTIESALDIIECLQNAGFEAVFCGGAVRDFILGIEPHDIDIATSATPDEVEALFPKTVAVGKSFGVVRVLIDEEEFEVATFRKDSNDSDGRRPNSVSFSSMKEDALRRDLTVNALFFDPIADKIFDFVGGQEDIKARHIRFVGKPDARIEEDKLRMLRVARFGSRGGWVIGRETKEAVIRNASGVTNVSAERIADELTKIFTQKTAHLGLSMLRDLGLLQHVLPRVAALSSCVQDKKNHPEGDVFTHVVQMLKAAGENLIGNPVLAWGIILHDIAKPDTRAVREDGHITFHGHAEKGAEIAREILTQLRFDGKTIDAVVDLVKQHDRFFDVKGMKGSTRLRFISAPGFDNLLELHRCDCVGSNGDVSLYDYVLQVRASTPLSQIRPEKFVDGHDLIAMGFKPGKLFKEITEAVENEQREGRVFNKEDAIAFVKKFTAKVDS